MDRFFRRPSHPELANFDLSQYREATPEETEAHRRERGWYPTNPEAKLLVRVEQPDDGDDMSGDREPRRPLPLNGAGGVELELLPPEIDQQ